MTPAQKKRLGELMMNDIINQPDPCQTMQFEQIASQLQVLQGVAPTRPSTIEEILDGIEHLQAERAAEKEDRTMRLVEQMFDREELFRFAYVPFVIAELVWDYADTVIIMSRHLNNPATRKLSRAIRDARRDYDSLRRQHIDAEHRERELENGYIFEDAVNDITSQLLLNVRLDIKSEYPQLNDESRDLLLAVYQCHILSRALLKYIDKQLRAASKRIGNTVGDILPSSYYIMDKLIPEYIGDKPASERFKKLMGQYIDTLATQIALIGLNDASLDDNDNQEAEQ